MRTTIFVALCAVLLSGCVQLHMSQTLHRDGTADITVQFISTEEVLKGFRNMPINPDLADRFTYEESPTNISYKFQRVAPGTYVFRLNNESKSFMGIEDFTLTKRFKFPYHYYTYTITPSSDVGGGDQVAQMLKQFEMKLTVHTFATVASTSGEKIDANTVLFTLDPTSTAVQTIEFKESFWSKWFSKNK